MAAENPTPKIHFPKGEGFKIINNATEAKVNDTIYILPMNAQYAEMIVVDSVGRKRKIGIGLPFNIALLDQFDNGGVVIKQGNTYKKEQIDNFIEELQFALAELESRMETAESTIASHTTQISEATAKNNQQDGRLNNFGNILADHLSRIEALEAPEGGVWQFPSITT
ncbi:chromosome segregation ATPase [Chryseobacterium rhizosphaerae]|uniref:hypothetical protein n=1 Tax=Chryseobacterium rhizosphaerae TaxID=395937 RepID=UPI002865BE43|nr:hypothetical protein [Chryseobacterium rhizosphaerae]MDR6548547.1 chromosome segregation ATPase [Chryseobacterium rhizosphaerae]